ncbi:phytoene desaturase family protein [Streptacidiphilus sp. MAP5-3]|uniref:phytoene desaturase family protein n=1 Tax=unclassified Streptacidiphilus TaxID=2643834 RepID=UPI0035148122
MNPNAASAPARSLASSRYDVVVIGGGHNGLVAAAYLARAGRRVAVLERQDHAGGAAVSAQVFAGVDARLSRYSYLVSLLPRKIVSDLGLRLDLKRRRYSSYTPYGAGDGLLVDNGDDAATAAGFRSLTGGDREFAAWQEFYGRTRKVADAVFPTLTEPLPDRDQLHKLVADAAGEETWQALFERPIGEAVEAVFTDDVVRGIVLTDALIGTFASAHDASLRQNACFLYHVIGNGTGDWDVPVGGMGSVTGALTATARAAGAELLTDCEVTSVQADGHSAEVRFVDARGAERTVGADHVLCNAAPRELARLVGDTAPQESVEGAQLKVNMLLTRLPRLRDRSVDPHAAFAGTFHIAESYRQLETAYRQAADGSLPSPAPSEVYCHSLTDPSILGPELRSRGYQTLTLFALHQPARLFAESTRDAQHESALREAALRAVLAPLDAVLDEPIADCLAVDADGRPCVEARTPLDLDADLGLPGGNIFHRPLVLPFAEAAEAASPRAGRWGVGTPYAANLLLCGAGAPRGGGVSGIPGHNAAMAVLGR